MVEECATSPEWAGCEEGGEDVDEALEVVGEGGERGCLWWDSGWVGVCVVLHLPGVDFHGGLGVEEGSGSGEGVGDGFDGGVLAVRVVVGDGGSGEDGWGNDICGRGGGGLGEVEVVGFESRVVEREDGRAEVVEEGRGSRGVDEVGHRAPEVGGGDDGDGFE